MSSQGAITHDDYAKRYEVMLRISEALSACREPEEVATTLANELEKLFRFDHLWIAVLKDNSQEIEYRVWGKGAVALPDLPFDELAGWEAMKSQSAVQIVDWEKEKRFSRFKEWAIRTGVGSTVSVPLTTAQRRLGVFGINRDSVSRYSEEDISLLRLIGRVVAFALDDGLNLRRARRQSDRLQLLLNLTSRITSNLELQQLLRAVAANIREVMQCDFVAVTLLDLFRGKARLYAVDFPHGKGFIQEEETVSIAGAGKRALETLTPVIVNSSNPADIPPEIRDKVVAEGLKSTRLIPLVTRGRALGSLVIARTKPTPFTSDDVEFLNEASGQIAIAIENALAFQEISDLKDRLAQENVYLTEEIRSGLDFDQIIGQSPALRHVLQLVETVAQTDSTVLLLGETGTGKELIAHAVHDHSSRQHRTFVKINCSAIPTGLLESELFGHEKGAFTGAITQKIGRLELAHQGTLFLDEVGDIPIEIQPKLLRALQEREFERLGSTHTRKVNVRLIAATNRDLQKMVAERQFRSDLYYRLNVFPIQIPPLRKRKEDISLLASYFVQKFSRQMQKKIDAIPASVMKRLTEWPWPGNIRELENFIERAVILTSGKSLNAPLGELRDAVTKLSSPADEASSDDEQVARIVKKTIESLKEMRPKKSKNDAAVNQRHEIERVLRETNGRVGGPDGAAVRLGINRTTLLSRMKKLGLGPYA